MIRRAAWLVLAALLLAAGPASAQQFQGSYTLAGETADGSPYQGRIVIAPRDQAYDVEWTRLPGMPRRGFGLRLDNVLGIGAEDGDEDFGIVLYRVKGGHLDGIWQGNLSPRVLSLGRETLDGPESLEGTYAISLGLNPGGSRYYGTAKIHRTGSTFAVDWYTPTLRYIGTGVLVGDIFVVGYSEHRRSGVAAYCLRSVKVVEGVTAAAADTALGAEEFWAADAQAPAPDRLELLRGGNAVGACGGPIAARPAPATGAVAALR